LTSAEWGACAAGSWGTIRKIFTVDRWKSENAQPFAPPDVAIRRATPVSMALGIKIS
jgi:hypothetical protein